VAGEKVSDVKVARFAFPPLMHTNFADKLPYFIDRRLRKAITTRPHVEHDKCVLCNKCVNICPPAIMSSAKKIKIEYAECIRCFCCQEACPTGAILPKDGWLKKIIPGL
jgi:formate hydrogenlyase subunit 6/NADH:ubiquinone oxidoreductase subunit I